MKTMILAAFAALTLSAAVVPAFAASTVAGGCGRYTAAADRVG